VNWVKFKYLPLTFSIAYYTPKLLTTPKIREKDFSVHHHRHCCHLITTVVEEEEGRQT